MACDRTRTRPQTPVFIKVGHRRTCKTYYGEFKRPSYLSAFQDIHENSVTPPLNISSISLETDFFVI